MTNFTFSVDFWLICVTEVKAKDPKKVGPNDGDSTGSQPPASRDININGLLCKKVSNLLG